ncbi:MAG: nucleotide sugar dehydrogenase [Verrucomicrobiia bacterium]
MTIGFAGLSHLGTVTSIATAAKGFDVVGFDPDAQRCADLTNQKLPVSEPQLSELLMANRSRLRFTQDVGALTKCRVVVVSLDVPTDASNRSDLTPLRKLIDHIVPALGPETTLVILSQVTPGFTRSLKVGGVNLYYQVETLIFGRAVERALQPERFIVGCANPSTPLPAAYAEWLRAFGCPVLPMRYESAELAKISINFFLVSSVATTNTLAELCEAIGADWSEIAPALRLDKRIGPHAYLGPGLGIAGGNLERDLITVQILAEQHGTDVGIVSAWLTNSWYRRDWVLRWLHEAVLSKTDRPVIAVWGLAYKQDTASTKNSPALALLESLGQFPVYAYDPQAKAAVTGVTQCPTALDACEGATALVVMTPWREFSSYSAAQIRERMPGRVVIDPFGMLDGRALITEGFSYYRLGGQ